MPASLPQAAPAAPPFRAQPRPAPLTVKPVDQRIPLTPRERTEAAELLNAFVSGCSTRAEKERLRELERIAFVNGESLYGSAATPPASPPNQAPQQRPPSVQRPPPANRPPGVRPIATASTEVAS